MDCNELLLESPYGSKKNKKEEMLLKMLKEITRYHREKCPEYGHYLQAFHLQEDYCQRLEEIPFLPVTIFKELSLKSISEENIFKELTSSGTTGQKVSHIYLDQETARIQQKGLCQIMNSFIGTQRIPFLVIDSPDVLKNRELFSARGAAVAGFSIFASNITYGYNKEMKVDWETIKQFLNKNQSQKILIFGFTSILWQFCQQLEEKGVTIKNPNAIVLHGGGWKKLEHEKISRECFQQKLQRLVGCEKVYDYYGMAEQTGSIYMECEYGHLHASSYSDILIRDKETFAVLPKDQEGLIEVMTPFAQSYPGHAILTEDLGILLGEDDCPCGRCGKYFRVTGRLKKAEVRGCSDTYEYRN